MSFIQREHDKLMELCQETPQGETYNALYAAKQALAWVLDPDTCASPSAQIGRHYSLSINGTKGTGIAFENNEDRPAGRYAGNQPVGGNGSQVMLVTLRAGTEGA